MARDETLFTYLSDSRADADVVVADGRLGVGAMRNESVDLLVVDAFSSDAIPVHLLTREAISLYASKLRPGGAIAFNVSSRYFDLAPVVAASARDLGLVAAQRSDLDLTRDELRLGKEMSSWVAVAHAERDLGRLLAVPGWKPLHGVDARAWTDDFSDPLRALKW
jgi:spermidine synthase